MRRETIIWVLLIISRIVFAQQADQSGSNKYANEMTSYVRTFGLTDFRQAKPEFGFRLNTGDYVLEIMADSNRHVTGQVVYYIYHYKKSRLKKMDTLYRKITLDTASAKKIDDLIRQSDLRNILEWDLWAADARNYTMEFLDGEQYIYKTFYGPYALQNEVPQTAKVIEFLDTLDKLLHAEEQRAVFEKSLPKKGCYLYGGYIKCYVGNTLYAGLSGGYPWPVGIHVSYYLRNSGRFYPYLSFWVHYLSDLHQGYELSLDMGKSRLFVRQKNIKDFISYSYQRRERSMAGESLLFQHQWSYGLSFRPVTVYGGVYMRDGDKRSTGPVVGLNKSFVLGKNLNSQWHLLTDVSLFKRELDFRISLSKAIHINNGPSLDIGISMEQWAGYRQIFGRVSIVFSD